MGSLLHGIPIDTSLYITVVLITSALCFGDDECLTLKRIKCYECSSKTHKFCGDPFNASHPDAHSSLKNCDAACVKWVRIKQGHTKPFEIRRTCTTRVSMSLHADLVCMSESSSGVGHICFCNTKKCNSAPCDYTSNVFLVLTMATMATFLASNYWTQSVRPEYVCGLVTSLFLIFNNVIKFKFTADEKTIRLSKETSVENAGVCGERRKRVKLVDTWEPTGQFTRVPFTDVANDSINRYAITNVCAK